MRFAVGDIVVCVSLYGPRPTGRGTVTKAEGDYGFVSVDFREFHGDGVPVYIIARELRLVSAVELLADLAG